MKKYIEHLHILIVSLLSITLLFGCQRIDSGIIVNKQYEPYREYETTLLMYSGNIPIMIPQREYDYPDYVIYVKGTYKGKERTEKWYISKSLYDSLNIGGSICANSDCSEKDNNNLVIDKN